MLFKFYKENEDTQVSTDKKNPRTVDTPQMETIKRFLTSHLYIWEYSQNPAIGRVFKAFKDHLDKYYSESYKENFYYQLQDKDRINIKKIQESGTLIRKLSDTREESFIDIKKINKAATSHFSPDLFLYIVNQFLLHKDHLHNPETIDSLLKVDKYLRECLQELIIKWINQNKIETSYFATCIESYLACIKQSTARLTYFKWQWDCFHKLTPAQIPNALLTNNQIIEYIILKCPELQTLAVTIIKEDLVTILSEKCKNLKALSIIYSSCLTQLPDKLISNLEELELKNINSRIFQIYDTKLKHTDRLRKLTLDFANLLILQPIYFPQNLLKLKISHVNVNNFDMNFPENLQHLELQSVKNITNINKFPPKLSVLILDTLTQLQEINLSTLTNLVTLELLRLMKLKDIPSFPTTLQKLTLRELNAKSIPLFPTTLQKLNLNTLPITHYLLYPEKLKKLEASFLHENTIRFLPIHLEKICISLIYTKSIDLSKNIQLKKITITGCSILEQLNINAQKLKFISLCQVKKLSKIYLYNYSLPLNFIKFIEYAEFKQEPKWIYVKDFTTLTLDFGKLRLEQDLESKNKKKRKTFND